MSKLSIATSSQANKSLNGIMESNKLFMFHDQSIAHEIRLEEEEKAVLRSLDVLKRYGISDRIIRKMTSAGISRAKLQDTYIKKGRKGIFQLLSIKQEDNKHSVTNHTRIIEDILAFLETSLKPAYTVTSKCEYFPRGPVASKFLRNDQCCQVRRTSTKSSRIEYVGAFGFLLMGDR